MELLTGMSGNKLRTIEIEADFVVAGGGLAGVCAAISAARRGVNVCLINDRPVLGGNASSEVRVWALGATSHMGNNNRFSREGGVIDEILSENLYRNKEGNPVLFDMVLMDKVLAEKNIKLLLNTAVYDVTTLIEDSGKKSLQELIAFSSSSETRYIIKGRMFADCSGDGVVSHLSGVSYSIGAEDKEVYGEGFAPDTEKYGRLMGDTIFFYMKDTGRPVKYVAPDFALKDVEKHISKIHNSNYFNTGHHGCKYWWLEWGGRLDTIHDTEQIKYELWKVVYGLWDYIKNSGKFPDMENYTLEWVGTIPGKRESRRMKGLYTLTQNDIVNQVNHYDAVSYGGWAIDLHPADGVYASGAACNQWHSKGIYQIPYRCYIGDEVENLFFGGRIISTSHVANGSTRVMCTSAHGGEVIGTAAALCIKNHVMPEFYADKENVAALRISMEESGHFVPGCCDIDKDNLINEAEISVSSVCAFRGFEPQYYRTINHSVALIIPLLGKVPAFDLYFESEADTSLQISLRVPAKSYNYTPEVTIASKILKISKGHSVVPVDFEVEVLEPTNAFITVYADTKVKIGMSEKLSSGIATVFNQINEAVSNYGRQDSPDGLGFDSFEFWCPKRRPDAGNLALRFHEPVPLYSDEALMSPLKRPFMGSNAWAADMEDKIPEIEIKWRDTKKVERIILFFDNDFDHAMEPIQMGHYDNVTPTCIRSFRIKDNQGKVVYQCNDNHYGTCDIKLSEAIETDKLVVSLDHPDLAPASVFHVIVK